MMLAALIAIVVLWLLGPMVVPQLTFPSGRRCDSRWMREMARKFGVRGVRFRLFSEGYPNAYAFGLLGWKTILIDESLLLILQPDEARAVIVHELGHHRLGHLVANYWRLVFFRIANDERRLQYEFEADEFAAREMGAELLISALRKLEERYPNENLGRRISRLESSVKLRPCGGKPL
jgi:Zn-dependent protease with chaperone function